MTQDDLALMKEVKKKGDSLHAGLKKTKPYQLIQTYGKGLNREELESFFTRETVQTFSFYHRDFLTHSKNEPRQKFENGLTVAKNLFLTFLLKLTPARRLCYAMALVLFVWGLFEVEWWWKIGSAFVILNILLAMELADKLLTKDELEVARAIQFSLQPDQHPRIDQLSIASHFQPASDVGGDYYDFCQTGEDRLTIILGDVSGKGMPAALYAMKLQGLFELLGRTDAGPKEMLVEMNDVFSERMRKNYFITALVGVLDFKKKELSLARAGHNLPLYFQAASGETTWLNPNGLGIGMAQNGVFRHLMEEKTVPLEGGDVLLFYTDGITEAMNRSDEVFGYRRLEETVTRTAHLGADAIKEAVLSELRSFTRGAPLADDVTLVVTQVKG